MMTVTSPDEKYAYVLGQAYMVNVAGGGEAPRARDTIVQERLNGQAPPQFVSCVSPAPTPDCTEISNAGAIYAAASEVMAPDGHNLYVASRSGVARFAIEPSGGLRYAECFRTEAGSEREQKECFAPTGSAGSEETEQLAIAPDQKDLYLTIERRLIDIQLGAGGTMSLGRCYRFRSICPWGGAELEGEGMAAVTANGQMVVNVMSDNQVNAYKRESNGSLRFTGCIGALVYQTALTGDECPTPPGEASALQTLEAIAVAPNSRDVYVTGGFRGGLAGSAAPITLLHLTPAGSLEFAGCWGVEVAGCTNLPLPATWWATIYQVGKRIAVSRDGTHLVLGTERGNDLLRIDPKSGALSWEGCVGYEPGCEHLEAGPIGGQGGSVEFVPSGQEVWMDDAGTAVRMRLGATAPAEVPPPVSTSGRAHVSEYTVDFCAPVPAHGPNVSFYYEIEGPPGQLFYTPASPNPYECSPEGLSANTHIQLGNAYRYRLVSRTPEGTAHGPWASFTTEACPHPGEEGRQTTPVITSNSLTWSSGTSYSCTPHKAMIEYGETPRYGHAVMANIEPGMRGLWKEGSFYVSVSGLRPQTTYYWRLSVENHNRMEAVREGASATSAPAGGAIEMFAETGTATAQGSEAVSLTGYVWSGDTPVSVAAEVFNEAREGAEPIQTIPLGQLPASREQAVVTTTASGLECGRTYNWRLLSEASYGKSLGGREPLTIRCPGSPEVVKNPASASVIEGETATFEAAATGQPAPTVQWEVSRNGGVAWEAIAGATSSTLTLALTSASETGNEYRAVFKNSVGRATTGAAVLSVSPRSGETKEASTKEAKDSTSQPASGATGSSTKSALSPGGSPFGPALLGVLGQQLAGPSLSLRSGRLQASRNGSIRMVVRCPLGLSDCRGSLSIRSASSMRASAKSKPRALLFATISFFIKRGTRRLVSVRLSSHMFRLLERKHAMGITVALLTQGGGESIYRAVLNAPQ